MRSEEIDFLTAHPSFFSDYTFLPARLWITERDTAEDTGPEKQCQ
jgi:hypothetical protein